MKKFLLILFVSVFIFEVSAISSIYDYCHAIQEYNKISGDIKNSLLEEIAYSAQRDSNLPQIKAYLREVDFQKVIDSLLKEESAVTATQTRTNEAAFKKAQDEFVKSEGIVWWIENIGTSKNIVQLIQCIVDKYWLYVNLKLKLTTSNVAQIREIETQIKKAESDIKDSCGKLEGQEALLGNLIKFVKTKFPISLFKKTESWLKLPNPVTYECFIWSLLSRLKSYYENFQSTASAKQIILSRDVEGKDIVEEFEFERLLLPWSETYKKLSDENKISVITILTLLLKDKPENPKKYITNKLNNMFYNQFPIAVFRTLISLIDEFLKSNDTKLFTDAYKTIQFMTLLKQATENNLFVQLPRKS